mmetsp:Transcript_2292/g.3126  ORF Transcript_2292/g.3126 Transcript_2292/m.3126 type:complete len:521 (+) Transcript_2292:954-2516(+)
MILWGEVHRLLIYAMLYPNLQLVPEVGGHEMDSPGDLIEGGPLHEEHGDPDVFPGEGMVRGRKALPRGPGGPGHAGLVQVLAVAPVHYHHGYGPCCLCRPSLLGQWHGPAEGEGHPVHHLRARGPRECHGLRHDLAHRQAPMAAPQLHLLLGPGQGKQGLPESVDDQHPGPGEVHLWEELQRALPLEVVLVTAADQFQGLARARSPQEGVGGARPGGVALRVEGLQPEFVEHPGPEGGQRHPGALGGGPGQEGPPPEPVRGGRGPVPCQLPGRHVEAQHRGPAVIQGLGEVQQGRAVVGERGFGAREERGEGARRRGRGQGKGEEGPGEEGQRAVRAVQEEAHGRLVGGGGPEGPEKQADGPPVPRQQLPPGHPPHLAPPCPSFSRPGPLLVVGYQGPVNGSDPRGSVRGQQTQPHHEPEGRAVLRGGPEGRGHLQPGLGAAPGLEKHQRAGQGRPPQPQGPLQARLPGPQLPATATADGLRLLPVPPRHFPEPQQRLQVRGQGSVLRGSPGHLRARRIH